MITEKLTKNRSRYNTQFKDGMFPYKDGRVDKSDTILFVYLPSE